MDTEDVTTRLPDGRVAATGPDGVVIVYHNDLGPPPSALIRRARAVIVEPPASPPDSVAEFLERQRAAAAEGREVERADRYRAGLGEERRAAEGQIRLGESRGASRVVHGDPFSPTGDEVAHQARAHLAAIEAELERLQEADEG